VGDASEDSSTRYLQTRYGVISYLEVADHVAEHLAGLLDRVAFGDFSKRALDVDLLCDFHGAILEPVVPNIAGKLRMVDVTVGKHLPPPYWEVRMLLRECLANLEAQLSAAGEDLERQIEALAYAEGEILRIHPFEDFNGRAVRAFLMEVLERLDLPPVELSVQRKTQRFEDYKLALRANDTGDPRLLREFWVARFESME